MYERCGNVTENKGSISNGQERTRYVIENKYSYSFNTGMSLKIQAVSR